MTKIEPIHFLVRPALFRAASQRAWHRAHLPSDAFFGLLVQHGRGVYSKASAKVTNTEALLFRASHAIAALDTALWLQGARATEPSPIWIAISQDARRPHLPPIEIKTLRWSRPPHPEDIATFGGEGDTAMRTFTLAKTAVDFIRARRRIGVIRAYAIVDLLIRWKKLTEDELVACAERNRAIHPVREYLARREDWR